MYKCGDQSFSLPADVAFFFGGKQMKRVLSLFLAVVFVLSMLPVSAMAEGEACTQTEGCTLPDGHDGDCSLPAATETQDEPESSADPSDAKDLPLETVAVVSVTVGTHEENASMSLTVGDTLRLDAAALPSDATNPAVVWTSDALAVATVDENGLVTALSAGSAKIRATAADGSGAYGELTVTVAAGNAPEPAETETLAFAFTVFADGDTIDADGAVHYKIESAAGDEIELEPTYETNGAVSFIWQRYDAQSENADKYVDLDPTINDTAAKRALKLTAENDMLGVNDLYRCAVSVAAGGEPITRYAYFTLKAKPTDAGDDDPEEPILVSSITLSAPDDADCVDLTQTLQLTAAVLPEDAANKTLAWTSSDESIATVDENGLVTPLCGGSVTITATAQDAGAASAALELTVNDAIQRVSLTITPDPHPTCEQVTKTVEAYYAHIIQGRKLGGSNNIPQVFWNANYSVASMIDSITANDYTSCLTGSSSGTSNHFTGLNMGNAIECAGFSMYIATIVFGTLPRDTNTDNGKVVGDWERVNQVAADFRVKPGDICRIDGSRAGSHSIFIYKVEGDTVGYIECNSPQKNIIHIAEASISTINDWINDNGRTYAQNKCYVWISPSIDHVHDYGSDGFCRSSDGAEYDYSGSIDRTVAGVYKLTKDSVSVWSRPYSTNSTNLTTQYGITTHKGQTVKFDYKLVNRLGSTWYHIAGSEAFQNKYIFSGNVEYAWTETATDTTAYTFKRNGVAVRSEPFSTATDIATQRGVTILAGDTIETECSVTNSKGNAWVKIKSGSLAGLYVYADNLVFKAVQTDLRGENIVLPRKMLLWGDPFTISGTIKSNYKVKEVTVLIECSTIKIPDFEKTVAVDGYEISIESVLNQYVDLSSLASGCFYKITIYAKDEMTTERKRIDYGLFSIESPFYSISFDAPGCTNVPPAGLKHHNLAQIISDLIPFSQYHDFLYWETDDGTIYYPGGAIPADVNHDLVLHAVLDPYLCTILYDQIKSDGTYDDGSGEWDPRFNSAGGLIGLTVTLDTFTPVRAGYTFVGWSLDDDGQVDYQPGDTIYCSCDLIALTPVWSRTVSEAGAGVIGGLSYHTYSGKTEIWNKIYADELANDEIVIDDYSGTGEMLIIPSQINGKTVASLRSFRYICFHDGDSSHVCETFPDCSVTEHGFTGVPSFDNDTVKSIMIPSCVRMIADRSGSGIFANMSALERINVSDESENYRSIDGVLYNKSGTTLLAYPNGKKDASFTVPDGVTSISDYAFTGNPYIRELNLPNSLTSIGWYAFSDMQLASLVIPAQVRSIGSNAFAIGTLTSITFLGEKPTFSDGSTFSYGSSVHVYYPASQKASWDPTNTGLFKGYPLTAFEDTGVGASLTIRYSADGANSVPADQVVLDRANASLSAVLPNKENSIFEGWATSEDAETALYQGGQTCDLSAVEGDSLTLYAVWSEDSGFVYYLSADGESVVISGSTNRSIRDLVIPDTIRQKPVVTIAEGAFRGYRQLETVTFGRNVDSIQNYAFYGCIKLRIANFLGNPPSDLGDYAFYGNADDFIVCYPDGQETEWQHGNLTFGGPLFGASIGLVSLSIQGDWYVTAGKSIHMQLTSSKGADVSDAASVWTIEAGGERYAAIDAKGNVTAKAVTEEQSIVVVGSAPSVSAMQVKKVIRILPLALRVFFTDEDGEPAPAVMSIDLNDADNLIPYGDGNAHALIMGVETQPSATYGDFKIVSSNPAVASVYYDQTFGELRFIALRTGTANITAATTDGSNKTATVKINVVKLSQGLTVGDALGAGGKLTSGKKTQLTASFTGDAPNNLGVTWYMDGEYTSCAALSSTGLLTAKAVTQETVVRVKAIAKDGNCESAEHEITIVPLVDSLSIKRGEAYETGKTICLDLNDPNVTELTLDAELYPADAAQACVWTDSDLSNAYATCTDHGDGTITISGFKGKAGTVTLTAKAKDGSNKTATVKLQFAKLAQAVNIAAATTELRGGASLQLTNDVTTNAALTDKTLVWSLSENALPYASISSTGKLATRAVPESTTITVTATVKANPTASDSVEITLRPTVQRLVIRSAGALWSGVTHPVALGTASISLAAEAQPADAFQTVTWKTSSSLIATVDQSGVVTPKKAGKVTITATAKDGSGQSASTTLVIGTLMTGLTITNDPSLNAIRSGKYLQLKTAYTNMPTNKTIQWSLSDPTDAAFASVSSAGRVTAKTVYEPHTVTILAKAADNGGAYANYDVRILPASDTLLNILDDLGSIVTKKTLVHARSEGAVQLSARMLGSAENAAATWKSSSSVYAAVDANGLVTLKRNGSVTITATSSGRTATITLKIVTMAQSVTLSGGSAVSAGKTLTFKAAVLPADATSKSVKWELSDASVASISATGVLTAKKAVTTPVTITVYATAKDGSGKFGTMDVTIYPIAENLSVTRSGQPIENTTLVIDKNDSPTVSLETAIYPSDANPAVVWSPTSTSGAAYMEQDGTLHLVKAGTVTITAKAKDGSGKAASFKVTVLAHAKEIGIRSKTNTFTTRGGGQLTLLPNFGSYLPTNQKVAWRLHTGDAPYASISAAGVLTAKAVTAPRQVTVTVVSDDNKALTATQAITILPSTTAVQITAGGANVSGKTLTLNLTANETTLALAAQSLPTTALQAWLWSSSSSTIAVVDANGVVTAQLDRYGNYRTGTVTITAKASDGSGKRITTKISIVRKVSDITLTSATGLSTVTGGKQLTIRASLAPANATSKTVTWSLRPQDLPYASVSSYGVVTTKRVTAEKTILLTCASKDGGATQTIAITVTP